MGAGVKRGQAATLIGLLFLSSGISTTESANYHLNPAKTYNYILKTFIQNNVRVDIRADLTPGNNIFLSAAFTPHSGYHLYSTRLPKKGIDGAGRPTKFDISTQKPSGLKFSDSITDSPRPFNVTDKSLSKPLAIYPAGPVTLTRKGKYSPGTYNIIVRITYMSCKSDGGCTIPVENKQLGFTLKISDKALIVKEML
ncbi:protein-disulfide reductase DsbD family protein [Deinococcus ruber]|uniref:protein-disulfide reductase DsbD family protein n=1 Tax=Deinococcus ruber TaxID=1848197 RepID=UPI001668524F|nr:protein-disulfide reductase DsbD family protein [Deinococcus ruber]